ncbi:DNA-binding transcriptional regulator Fis [Thiohalomonas denitrificans]|uniref:Putative Fis-like DNA-binding protein n=1 Tax=Thiohalomonas denitrificans TaxID=415747 RepID=A0A1G5PRH5_9GAMM|nr:DNA-binding transcriptional regulator Fis [Thiohalomonas denitrificans]SCZ52042.1 Fis family transcriptional regulator, factor for inversion stimulation protein [Thiohalomonas denitrificans]
MKENGNGGADIPLNGHVREALEQYFKDLGGHYPANLYQLMLNEVEKPLFEMVMRYARGNQTRAAEILGLNRGTLRKKLKIYGLND